MSFQDGWIEVKKRKHRTQFLLRYWVRDLSWPEGWKKKSEILKGCTTRKQAERERIRRMEEINKSNQASASTMLGPTAMTLEDFSRTVWPHYLQTRGAKESTVYGYESLLRAHILPALGSKRLDQITPTDVSVFLNRLAKSKEKPTPKGGPKLLNVYALLRTMFEVAVESGLILASPVRKKIHRPEYRVAEKPVLDLAQLRAVLEKIPESWMPFFLCLALTTLRIGELIALHWSDVSAPVAV